MKTKSSLAASFSWLAISLAVCSITVGLMACGKKGAEPQSAAPQQVAGAGPSATPTPSDGGALLTLSAESVKYARLEYADAIEAEVVAPIETTGRVTLNEDRTIRVGSYIEGRVMKVLAKVGDRVTEGQPLAEIHTHDVHEAGANLVQARAGLSQKRTQEAFARTTLERAERLFQAKALSQQELDRAKVEYESSQQAVIHSEAELERAKGHLELLGLSPTSLNFDAPVVIKAPGGGVIMQREVTPGAGVSLGTHLFTISDLSQVWVLAEVDEKRLPLLRVGMPMSLNVAAYPGVDFSGRIARIGEVLNPQTRMVEVRCLVDNRSGKLKPEMYVVTRIDSGEKSRALMIPRNALQDIEGKLVIFIAKGGDKFEKRMIKIGREAGDKVEVLEGVSLGDKVVTSGGFLLKSELLKSRMAEEE